MNIKYIGKFKKHFKERVQSHSNLYQKFNERVDLFVKSPDDPILKDHSLKGSKQRFRAFSITGDIRVIYFLEADNVYFVDIGSHNQVY